MNGSTLAQTPKIAALPPAPLQTGLLQRKCACGGSPGVDGECAECRAKRLSLQRRASSPVSPTPAVPPIVYDVLSSPGQLLDARTRAFMEPRFGHDFSNVRVHSDAKAAESARTVNALAYTVGRNVVFGAGQYAPGTTRGQQLLAHELAHTVQQKNHIHRLTNNLKITHPEDPTERQAQHAADAVINAEPFTMTTQETGKIARQASEPLHVGTQDAENILGEQLVTKFPKGVTVAFYGESNDEAVRRAKEWAQREQAIGPKHTRIKTNELVFGKAIPDSLEVGKTLTELGKVLSAAVAKASSAPNATSAAKVHTLAIFAHGTSNWCGLGSGITTSNVTATAKKISSSLANDVNVLLYACGGARGQTEEEEWIKGTWEGGGADSLAAEMRDALVDQGLGQSTVWGHTTTGHPSRNPALREFKATSGKGAIGLSYLDTYVFRTEEREAVLKEIREEITTLGYSLEEKQEASFLRRVSAEIKLLMYRCYIDAAKNKDVQYQEGSVGEMAPLHPSEVATLIRERWKTYWTSHKTDTINKLIKRLRLKKKL